MTISKPIDPFFLIRVINLQHFTMKACHNRVQSIMSNFNKIVAIKHRKIRTLSAFPRVFSQDLSSQIRLSLFYEKLPIFIEENTRIGKIKISKMKKKSLVCHHLFGIDINKNYFYYKEWFYFNYTYFLWKLWPNTFSEIVVFLLKRK